ncbi:MAG TPA: hypothetical protein VIW67_21765 [Terriglobales bacterium]|jgi:hypothetical protein
MPHRFEFDSLNRILRGRFEGQMEDSSLVAFYTDIVKYVAKTDPRFVIHDFSGVATVNISVSIVHELARSAPAVRNPAIPRFIVAPTPYVFGMSRMFQLVGEETRPTLYVVNSIDEVFKHLGITKPTFAPVVHD